VLTTNELYFVHFYLKNENLTKIMRKMYEKDPDPKQPESQIWILSDLAGIIRIRRFYVYMNVDSDMLVDKSLNADLHFSKNLTTEPHKINAKLIHWLSSIKL